MLEGCQSIARPAECRLASCLPHISQRYSPQLTPAALRSSQASIAFVPAGIWPPLQRVALSYRIGSMPRLRSVFAGLAARLGSAAAAAGTASATAAARHATYLIRIGTPTNIGTSGYVYTLPNERWTLCGNRVELRAEARDSCIPEQAVLRLRQLRIQIQQ